MKILIMSEPYISDGEEAAMVVDRNGQDGFNLGCEDVNGCSSSETPYKGV